LEQRGEKEAGRAAAPERGFQMTYGLRIMQGRLAEVVGNRQKVGRRETTVENDRRMRTFGWARAAARIASNLDSELRMTESQALSAR